jgi:imidazole glycerol-phosphate synthase subunit HisF
VPTGHEAVAWAREIERLGAGEIVLTSMDADGTRNGYDLEMTKAVVEAVDIPVVASGGAGHPEHLRAVLAEAGASAALAASIFHYGQYSIAESKEFLASRGVPVRRVAGVLPEASSAPEPVATSPSLERTSLSSQ